MLFEIMEKFIKLLNEKYNIGLELPRMHEEIGKTIENWIKQLEE